MAYLVGLGDDAKKEQLKQAKQQAVFNQLQPGAPSSSSGDGKILGAPPVVVFAVLAAGAWFGINELKKRRG